MSAYNRRSFITACAAAASVYSVTGRADRANRVLAPELEALAAPERVNIIESMAREDIPGAAVCLIHEGRTWIEGFGVTDRAANHPISGDTLFSIQSTSKIGRASCRERVLVAV